MREASGPARRRGSPATATRGSTRRRSNDLFVFFFTRTARFFFRLNEASLEGATAVFQNRRRESGKNGKAHTPRQWAHCTGAGRGLQL